MTKMRLLFNIFAVALVCLACNSLAQAQATRTWVSGVGDDANPCSRTAPCKTFAGAISKTAPAGEINVLDPGGFGAVTITKSMTIRAVCVEAGVLVSGTNAIVVAAGASDVVTLQGLDINGLNTGLDGIKFNSGGQLNVENCYIYEFTQNGIEAALTASGTVTVKNTVIRQCNGSGIAATTTAGTCVVGITHVDIDKCPNGVTIGANTFTAIGSSNILNAGTGNGLNTANGATVDATDTLFAFFSVGVNIVAGATVRLNNCVFANDVTGVANNGTAQSAGNNKFMGCPTDVSGTPLPTTVGIH